MWNGMLQFASLIVLAVIAWYAKETSLSLVRLRVFLDARDIEHRKDRTDDRKARGARAQSIDIWLRDTRAIWGKLFSSTERLRGIGEELVAHERTTIEMRTGSDPTTAARGDRDSDCATQVLDRPPARRSAPVPHAAPAEVAAGIGPRPLPARSGPVSLVSTRRPAPITVPDPGSVGVPSRYQTMTGIQPGPVESGERLSWEALKREGLIGSTVHRGRAVEPPPSRFPGTMLSMQAATAEPGSAPITPARSIAAVQTREVCKEPGCNGGFVAIGNGGIGRCPVCAGSGLVAVRQPECNRREGEATA